MVSDNGDSTLIVVSGSHEVPAPAFQWAMGAHNHKSQAHNHICISSDHHDHHSHTPLQHDRFPEPTDSNQQILRQVSIFRRHILGICCARNEFTAPIIVVGQWWWGPLTSTSVVAMSKNCNHGGSDSNDNDGGWGLTITITITTSSQPYLQLLVTSSDCSNTASQCIIGFQAHTLIGSITMFSAFTVAEVAAMSSQPPSLVVSDNGN